MFGLLEMMLLCISLTNDSKATVSVLYWYGNYPTLTESQVSDFLDPGSVLALSQLFRLDKQNLTVMHTSDPLSDTRLVFTQSGFHILHLLHVWGHTRGAAIRA